MRPWGLGREYGALGDAARLLSVSPSNAELLSNARHHRVLHFLWSGPRLRVSCDAHLPSEGAHIWGRTRTYAK